jgi:hypothetical protein
MAIAPWTEFALKAAWEKAKLIKPSWEAPGGSDWT